MLHNLGLSRNKLRIIFDSAYVQDLDDDALVKLFGKKRIKSELPYDFLINDDDRFTISTRSFYHDSPSTSEPVFKSMSAAPLYEFGKISISHTKRAKIFDKLPNEIKRMFPPDFSPALFHDGLGRVYKWEEGSDLYGDEVWSVAIPRAKRDEDEDLIFPEEGIILELFKKDVPSKPRIKRKYEVVNVLFTDPRVRKKTTLIVLKYIPSA